MKPFNLAKRYKHAWVLLYCPVYIIWFFLLEKNVTKNYYIIHSSFDDYIPFIEYFIIPYLLWFLFIAVTAAYLFLKDTQGFYKMAAFLAIGMTAFLLISTFFPNGVNLRPETFERDNIFVTLVKHLYRVDTSTNVLPSIHVFNSLGAYVAITHNKKLVQNKIIHFSAFLLTVSIIASTLFLKQHSIIDVASGFALAAITYLVVYAREPKGAARWADQPS